MSRLLGQEEPQFRAEVSDSKDMGATGATQTVRGGKKQLQCLFFHQLAIFPSSPHRTAQHVQQSAASDIVPLADSSFLLADETGSSHAKSL